MDFDVIFDSLFKMVDLAIILAIMGISQAFKSIVQDRYMPVVVTLLGIGAAFIMTPATHNWRLWAMAAIYYAGAADLFYTFVWQTILNKDKVNLFEMVANLLTKIGPKKEDKL